MHDEPDGGDVTAPASVTFSGSNASCRTARITNREEQRMSAANDWLAQRFETHRGHLRRVAYRMLGSLGEAEDAVQEAWLRLSRSEANDIDNLGGWLTTVVSRVCLDMLRSRKIRGE